MIDNEKYLIELAHTKMPFGKYQGYYLIDLPEYYVVWYHNKGFPTGKLGEQLALIYELKLNGLEPLIRNIKNNYKR
ncbi:MAG: DUF3820 family protein [Flavobacteriaceae bacterium]|jgi:uncharacterized protein (DUF3820 family)|nr:DUF3820 family protein [Flavobacteriaceae bacterium]